MSLARCLQFWLWVHESPREGEGFPGLEVK